MIHIIGDKAFLLRKFPAAEGRKLMMRGAGIRGILSGGPAAQLPVLAYVSVRVGADNWIPLSTQTMLDNHVPEGKTAEILDAILLYNCFEIHDIVEAPVVADALWLALDELVDEVITQCC